MNPEDYMADRKRALMYLNTLNQARFAEFFYEAVARWHQSRTALDGNLLLDCLTLAKCSYDGSYGHEGLLTELIALPTVQEYEEGNAREFTTFIESGDCERCGASVKSVAKSATCPVCGAEIGLT